MKIQKRRTALQGLTLIEVSVVLAITGVLAVIALTALARAFARSPTVTCLNNLKYLSLAARMWSNGHSERFPWMLSTNEGGTREFQPSAEVFRHFDVLSNDLINWKMLCCPADEQRVRKGSIVSDVPLANTNISYFVGLDADERFPQRFLSGDRNLTGGTTNGPLLIYSTNSTPGWGKNIHQFQGDIALSDGSVQQFTSAGFSNSMQAAFATMTNAEMRPVIPRVPGE